jgi:hypothetical protein
LLKSRGFWIGIIVSAVLIGLFARSTDFAEMKRAFEEANYWLVALSLPVYFLGLWVRTIRWQYLLRPVKRVPALRLFPVVLIGLMANNLIPARAGELARAYVLGEREKISKTTSLGTIAVDRLFDGVTLVPMMLIVAAFAGGDTSFPVGFGRSLNFAGLGLVMAVLFGAALAVLFYLALSDSGRHLLHRFVHRFAPAKVKPQVEGILLSFFEGLHALRNPVDLGIAWVMSGVSWTLEATMYFIVARAFGIHEGFHIFLLLTAAANLAIAIIASQGGIGPFELVVSKTIVAFGAAGASGDGLKKLADAYAIGLHATLLIPVVIIGLILMWSMDLTLGDMLKSRRDDGAPPSDAADDAGGRTVRAAKPAVEGNVPK